MKLPIFLDNHSTTPMDPRVLDTMLPYFVEKFGNAASRNHAFGWAAEEAVEQARKQIAKLIKADPKEVVFTSGATESDNLAIKGVLEMYKEKGDHIITSSTEHRAVLDTVKSLEGKGKAVVTYLPVDKFGMVNPEDVRKHRVLLSVPGSAFLTGRLQEQTKSAGCGPGKSVRCRTENAATAFLRVLASAGRARRHEELTRGGFDRAMSAITRIRFVGSFSTISIIVSAQVSAWLRIAAPSTTQTPPARLLLRPPGIRPW